MWFESSVNPKGIKTNSISNILIPSFESSVNPKGIKTTRKDSRIAHKFESSVNPKGIKTCFSGKINDYRLRVV